ncbi:hypothetical protein COY23_03830 [bacterium (Candidatus Torokbacteria) CG_4_10_14_0_2_um_filter_35_8]|nr:MAG: hypothetical protein COY23_03830 [bacterium (Candidatus Torokbacteria) CG_4_10_14_0_2_um_filter_35_8]
MKIALVNLCKAEDFAQHKYYSDSMSYLREEGINYVDFASKTDTVDLMVEKFHQALDSDAKVIWVIRGGLSCIRTLDKIDWDKVSKSNKKFYGLSDFTHFSTMAVSKGLICFYGQGLTKIKQYFPTKNHRKFITNLLKTGKPFSREAKSIFLSQSGLNISDVKVIGGHLLIFSFMQGQLKIPLNNRYVFIEYHHSATGEGLNELGYYLDQLLFLLKDNMPKGFILGRTELKDYNNTLIQIGEINKFYVEKLSKYKLPVYYLDHFENTITFS